MLFYCQFSSMMVSNLHHFRILLLVIVFIKFLKMSEGTTRVETLGAGEGAQTDLIAFTELHVTSELFESLLRVLVSRVNDPSVGLHKNCWTKVVLWMPPIRWASWLAASAKYTLIKSIEQLPIFNSLQVLSLSLNFLLLSLKEWIDRLVLSIKVAHINHKVLEDEHEHEWWHGRLLGVVLWDATETSQVMPSIDVHGTGATDTFTATSSEWESRIDLILDLDECVKEHGAALAHINVVGHILGPVIGVVGIASINVKPLHGFLLFISESLIELFSVVHLEHIGCIGDTDTILSWKDSHSDVWIHEAGSPEALRGLHSIKITFSTNQSCWGGILLRHNDSSSKHYFFNSIIYQ